MAGPVTATPSEHVEMPGGGSYRPALALLATLFCMWGFITVINNTLLPHLRSVFELNYLQTTLIESIWFDGYLIASIPAAKLIERIFLYVLAEIGVGNLFINSPRSPRSPTSPTSRPPSI